MSTFALVHGAWQSAGTWDLLAPLLQKQGHRIVRPVLSGLGIDQKNLSADTTLQRHINDVLAELSKTPEPVILVGHSYAGMIISGVVEASPAQVKSLVFLDAFIPEDGQSVLDLLPPEIGAHFRSVAAEHGNGWRLPGGDALLDLWGLKPGSAREFVRARLCDFTLRCFEEPLPLPENRKASVPSAYVACVAERYPSQAIFAPFAAKVRSAGGTVVEVDSGHDCQAELPDEVASVLLSVAQ